MQTTVFQRLQEVLDAHGVPYDVMRHPPVYTSQQAAEVRGTRLSSGAKALICKADAQFVMLVLPADKRLDSKRIRRDESIRSLRFARPEEVYQQTNLTPGAIPPLGSLFGLPTWCDETLGAEPTINFNAGDHGISISMRFDDYVSVERPKLGVYAREPG